MSSSQPSSWWGWSDQVSAVHKVSWAGAWMWLKDNLEGGTQPAQTLLGFAAWEVEKDDWWWWQRWSLFSSSPNTLSRSSRQRAGSLPRAKGTAQGFISALQSSLHHCPTCERPLRHPGMRTAGAVPAAEWVDSSSHTETELFSPCSIMDQESSYQLPLSQCNVNAG